MKNNYSLFGLPEDVRFCSKCTISNQRPSSRIEFKNKDSKLITGIKFIESVCSACVYNEKKKEIDWNLREKKLLEILNKYRKSSGYDCIVPGSGGKDSSYTAHILKYKYGMNPLTVTWSPHLYTDVGKKNFENWITIGGFDNILFTPNGKLHRLLTRLAFINLLHPFQPFIIGQKIIGPLIALKFNIPLVIYGENQAEYGNKIEDNENYDMEQSFYSIKNKDEVILGGKKILDIQKEFNFRFNDFNCYLPLDSKEVQDSNIRKIYLGYFTKWDPQEIYYYAAQNCGFLPNTERTSGSFSKYSSIDDKIDYFHYYTTFIKFGIGRATYDSSQEIRNGKITRDEGVALVRQFDSEFPHNYFKDFLNYISIDENFFWDCVDRFRSPHLWEKKNKKWYLKHNV
jgi:N-acetyl sugar amidotransferase